MNISNSRESDDEKSTNNGKKITPNPNLTTSISSWTKLRDPRIVRVSRAFGGKDRHSKVCTVRGLRDRRVRLSVPTAIQLYDLQDRLGLNQPSKVVDWLLDVAKHEIDELPPLQIPPGNFGQNLQSMINVAHASQSENLEGVSRTNVSGVNWEDYWNLQDKSKVMNKDQIFFQSSNQSSSVPLAFNNVVPNGSFLKLNPSNFGSYGSMAHDHHQENTSHNYLSGSHFMYPSHDHNSRDAQFDPKELNFEMLSSSSSSSHHHQHPLSSSHLYTINQGTMVRPFHLSMNPNQEHDQPDEGN